MAGIDGLSPKEVLDRVRAGQVNEVRQRTSRTVWEIIRGNVFTRFNALLGTLFAVILFVGSPRDSLFGGVLIANALIGIVQELRAKRVLDGLSILTAPKARVVRAGQIQDLPVAAIVVDDVVEIGAGDQITTDGVTLQSEALEVDESLLTGEAAPVVKLPDANLLSGSFVVAGRARYRATAVGASAYAHQLAEKVRRYAPARSELQTGINQILRGITWAFALLVPLLLASQLDAQDTISSALQSTIAGIVPMVPEGLVLLTSLALATAVTRLGSRRVLLQELPAVETLARVDVVCLDKTGTLTEPELSVDRLEPLADRPDLTASLGALAAADPAPNATLRAIAARYPPPAGWRLLESIPFSSSRKWSAASFDGHEAWFLGAADVLLADTVTTLHARQRAAALAEAGKPVLLLARVAAARLPERPPTGLIPVALVALTERVRTDASATLQYFAEQGVALKVVSGDHPNTIASVARDIGWQSSDLPVDARALPPDSADLARMVTEHTLFGRASPQDKETIVKALQACGQVVAMIGDGINDVLALKQADIGIAMGGGSSVARGVAQLVLLDGHFASLPPVLTEGRRVIANVERLAALFATKTVYALLLALAVGVADLVFPFLPRHLTLVGALTIGVPAFILSFAPNAAKAQSGFLLRVLRFAIPAGTLAFAATFSAYLFVGGFLEVSLDEARTTATLVLLFAGLWILLILSRPLTSARAALVAVMAAIFAVFESVPDLRTFFALELPSIPVLVTALIAVGIAGLGFEFVAYSVSHERRREGWLIRQIHVLLDPDSKPSRGLAVLGLVFGGSLLILFGVLKDVISGDPLVRADAAVFNLLQSLRSERVDRAMTAITELGDGMVVTAVTVVAAIWFTARKAWRTTIYLVAAIGSTALFTLFAGAMLRLPRPTKLYFGWEVFAFPSSHASVNAALYGFLAVLVAREIAPRWRPLIVAGFAIYVGSIASSRLYLGADWVSDVVAGLAFGVGWVALLAIAYLRRNPPSIGAVSFCAAIGLTLLVVGGIRISQQFSTDMMRYAVRDSIRSMPLAEWWIRGWTELPVRRVNLSGEFEEPLTVQWAGSLDALNTILAAHGWSAAILWSRQSGFAWLARHPKLDDLPVVPQLHNGRKAALLLVRAGPNKPNPTRIILSLWRAEVTLRNSAGSEAQVWVGTVIEEQMEKLAGIISVTRTSPDLETPRDLLASALPQTRIVRREGIDETPGWDGAVLLAHDPTVQPSRQ